MTTIPQNSELLKNFFKLLEAHRKLFRQERVYRRVVALALAELFVFARHTVTQLLMSLGLVGQDWSGWYRLYSEGRFPYEGASEVLFEETLKHVGEDELYVVGGDGTQTPRSSRKLEGAGWLEETDLVCPGPRAPSSISSPRALPAQRSRPSPPVPDCRPGEKNPTLLPTAIAFPGQRGSG